MYAFQCVDDVCVCVCVCVCVYFHFFSKLKHKNGRKVEAPEADIMQFVLRTQNAGNGFLEFKI